MLLEPLLVGLVAAPTRAGMGVALCAVAAFLARHPLRLVVSDLRRGVKAPRTRLAVRIAALYGLVALGGLLGALRNAPVRAFWPLLAALPLGLVQLVYDARMKGRQLLPEVLGGVALGSTVAVLMLAGGWPTGAAFGAWALLATRAVASILYVRARLRLDRKQPASISTPLVAHLVGLLVAAGLFACRAAPALGVVAFVVLLARASFGLSPWRRPVRPQQVGRAEVGYGALTAALLAVGYSGGL
jgi:hypothetical protein